jgi:ribA/ribD-fused uncharacterized protein
MSESDPPMRSYDLGACVAFSHPKWPWGALSNFSADFQLHIDGAMWPTTEHLYQACRFPHLPELQGRIRDNPSPLAAKMRAHKHADETRLDWEAARVSIMRWCLAVKLAQYRADFGALLLATGDRTLVEVSGDDAFWGAVPDGLGSRSATGANLLGTLLMGLRARLLLAGAEPSPGGRDDGGGDEGDDRGDADGDSAEWWVPPPPSGLDLRLLGRVIVGERAADHAEGAT